MLSVLCRGLQSISRGKLIADRIVITNFIREWDESIFLIRLFAVF